MDKATVFMLLIGLATILLAASFLSSGVERLSVWLTIELTFAFLLLLIFVETKLFDNVVDYL